MWYAQGTWFWQAGFILYNPLPGAVPWRADDHDQLMVVTMMFAWHMAGTLITVVCIGAAVAACMRPHHRHHHRPAQTAASAAGGTTVATSDVGVDEIPLLSDKRASREHHCQLQPDWSDDDDNFDTEM